MEEKIMAKKDEENFEELMNELEDITNKLENEKLPLEDSVKLFEKGIEISKKCNEKLENAEKRITILLNANSDDMSEEDFTAE
jgi:exodeoxyribonuclease VII small subunit